MIGKRRTTSGASAARQPDIRARTALKPAGGSLVMTVPAAVRKALGYGAGTELSVSIEAGRMVVEAVAPAQPAARVRPPKYTLDQLLVEHDADTAGGAEERAFQDAAPVGRETW